MIIFRSRNFQLSWAISEINFLPLERGILVVCVAVLVVAVWGPRDRSFGHTAPWKAGVRICWSSMEEYKRGCQRSYWHICIRCTHTVIGPTSVYTWSQFSGIWPVSDLPSCSNQRFMPWNLWRFLTWVDPPIAGWSQFSVTVHVVGRPCHQ